MDHCAVEAYEAAINEYSDSYPNRTALTTKYCLQPQDKGALIKCREEVSGC